MMTGWRERLQKLVDEQLYMIGGALPKDKEWETFQVITTDVHLINSNPSIDDALLLKTIIGMLLRRSGQGRQWEGDARTELP